LSDAINKECRHGQKNRRCWGAGVGFRYESSGSGYNKVDVILISCPRRILTFQIGTEGGKRRRAAVSTVNDEQYNTLKICIPWSKPSVVCSTDLSENLR